MSPPIFLILFHEPWRAMKIGVAVLRREHVAGVESHAERGRVRSEQRDRLGELVARAAPAEFRVRNVALVAIRKAEIVLARLGDAG